MGGRWVPFLWALIQIIVLIISYVHSLAWTWNGRAGADDGVGATRRSHLSYNAVDHRVQSVVCRHLPE